MTSPVYGSGDRYRVVGVANEDFPAGDVSMERQPSGTAGAPDPHRAAHGLAEPDAVARPLPTLDRHQQHRLILRYLDRRDGWHLRRLPALITDHATNGPLDVAFGHRQNGRRGVHAGGARNRGAVDHVQTPITVHLAVLVDHAVGSVDPHRDAAEVVHREGPTQHAPGWRIRGVPAQHPSNGPTDLPFGTVEASVGPVVPFDRRLVVVIKNESGWRLVDLFECVRATAGTIPAANADRATESLLADPLAPGEQPPPHHRSRSRPQWRRNRRSGPQSKSADPTRFWGHLLLNDSLAGAARTRRRSGRGGFPHGRKA